MPIPAVIRGFLKSGVTILSAKRVVILFSLLCPLLMLFMYLFTPTDVVHTTVMMSEPSETMAKQLSLHQVLPKIRSACGQICETKKGMENKIGFKYFDMLTKKVDCEELFRCKEIYQKLHSNPPRQVCNVH